MNGLVGSLMPPELDVNPRLHGHRFIENLAQLAHLAIDHKNELNRFYSLLVDCFDC